MLENESSWQRNFAVPASTPGSERANATETFGDPELFDTKVCPAAGALIVGAGGAVLSAKLADTDLLALIVIEQAAVPVQASPQPVKV
jgi:hypothetical protein